MRAIVKSAVTAMGAMICATALLACATASDDLPTGTVHVDSGVVHADTSPLPQVDAWTPTFDSSVDDGGASPDTRTDPIDTSTDDTHVDLDTGSTTDSAIGDAAIDTFVSDSGSPSDALVATDSVVSSDGGCGSPTGPGPGEGTTCTAAIAIDLDLTCTQTFVGDTCGGPTVASSCGSGQSLIYAITASDTRLYSIRVDPGFTLAAIPGPPLCGGAGTCVGAGTTTGVSKGSTQYWTVAKTGGGCGTYTLIVTPT